MREELKRRAGKLKVNKPMKLIGLNFIFALMIIVVATPITAQASTLTIYNQNCTHKSETWRAKKEVRVHVWQGHGFEKPLGCTAKYVTVRVKHRKTIELREYRYDEAMLDKCGNYKHEAA